MKMKRKNENHYLALEIIFVIGFFGESIWRAVRGGDYDLWDKKSNKIILEYIGEII